MVTIEPKPNCIIEQHDKHGACYMCCESCNYDNHKCHFCGTELYHDSYEDDAKAKRHFLSDCRPDLIEERVYEDGPVV
jgi:hypothetical protein